MNQNIAMNRSDFTYHLPPELIASEALPQRSASRLLHVAADGLLHRQMLELPDLLRAGDLLVFNDTRVIKARLYGQKATGGRVELLIERLLNERLVLAQMAASKKPQPGALIQVADGRFEYLGRQGDLFELRWLGQGSVLELLERHGELPLPHYFGRAARADDDSRYQSIFAKDPGAVAAPTASLHFDEALLAELQAKGVATTTVTLHVGAGTFQPVRVEKLAEHQMHAERFRVTPEAAAALAATRAHGGRVVAVGTTVARALESAFGADGNLAFQEGDTRLFITPGYRFKAVDVLLTNFHLPESTLLMLVSAFGGVQRLRDAYTAAIAARYRFYSYGDAMLIEPECFA
jgi:S-adenosylmethionine:tRNA ribosyltransferase-isomerase